MLGCYSSNIPHNLVLGMITNNQHRNKFVFKGLWDSQKCPKEQVSLCENDYCSKKYGSLGEHGESVTKSGPPGHFHVVPINKLLVISRLFVSKLDFCCNALPSLPKRNHFCLNIAIIGELCDCHLVLCGVVIINTNTAGR